MACTGIIYDPAGDPTDAGDAVGDASVDARVDAVPAVFTVTATAFASGSIEPAGALSVNPGDTLTFGINPRITPCHVTQSTTQRRPPPRPPTTPSALRPGRQTKCQRNAVRPWLAQAPGVVALAEELSA